MIGGKPEAERGYSEMRGIEFRNNSHLAQPTHCSCSLPAIFHSLLFPHLSRLPHTPLIALAGTGSGPGTGRAAATSRHGFGSHVSEGVPTGRRPAAGKTNAWVLGCGETRRALLRQPRWASGPWRSGKLRRLADWDDRRRRGAEAAPRINTREARPSAPLPDCRSPSA